MLDVSGQEHGLLGVIDTLETQEQLDELLRLATAPVIEGKGGA